VPFLASDAGRLWYEDAGQGPAVLFLHSALVDSRMWDPQFESWAERYHVIRLDFRMFGRSDPPAAPYSSIDDIASVLDACGAGRAAVVGSSAGGALELEFAVSHPDKMWAAVAVCAGVIGFEGPGGERHEELQRLVLEAREREGAAAAQRIELEYWCPSGVYRDSDELLWEIAQGARATFTIEDDPDRLPETPTVERLGEIAAPTLVVIADDDVAEMHSAADLLFERIPEARLGRMGGDHLPSFRRPAEFDALVLPFLDQAAPKD